MNRIITGFHLDEKQEWVAELDCYHVQHIRHNPPVSERPWMESQEGRDSKLGIQRECLSCDKLLFPDYLQSYKKTAVFNQDNIPAGLLKEHQTKSGVWGVIHILEGTLFYTIYQPKPQLHILNPNNPGIIPPEQLHRVEAEKPVKFFVEFYRKPASKIVDGIVMSGMGDLSQWMTKFQSLYLEKTGINCFPGSLNLKLESPYPVSKNLIRIESGEGGCRPAISIVPCKINTKKAFILRTDYNENENGHHNKNIVEIISDTKLRDFYDLKDGDRVQLELFDFI